jgi:molybdenum cofactor cytidylyltransferase
MNIAQALRCHQGMTIAAVGAGGKTSLLFALARHLPGKKIVTTTTHFALNQLNFGDYHFTDADDSLEKRIIAAPENAVIVISGTKYQTDRVNGPASDILENIKQISAVHGYTILIEADGSRRLPLKAYAEHEPVIPDWVELVVTVIGSSAIGKRLNDDTVFRADRFAEMGQAALDDFIDVEMICKMLLHPDGGLKHRAAHRHSVIVFNQADQLSNSSRELIETIIPSLLVYHDAILITSVQSAPEAQISTYERIAGVVLAAGESKRLGSPKQLLTYQGISFLRWTTLRALECGFSHLYVVLGYKAALLANEVADLPVNIIINPDWEAGQSTSVKCVLQKIISSIPIGGVGFMPVDQPFLKADTLKDMIAYHASNLGISVVPCHDNRRSSPVLIDRDHLHNLYTVKGDQGGRAILGEIKYKCFDIKDGNELIDIDTMDQYRLHIQDSANS